LGHSSIGDAALVVGVGQHVNIGVRRIDSNPNS